MNKFAITLAASAVLLVGGVASAQVVNGTTTADMSAGLSDQVSAPATIGFGTGLGIMVNAAQSVPAGGKTEALALIAFDATRIPNAAAIPTIPVTLVFDGAPASDFTNCALRNVNNLGLALNTGANAVPPLTSSAVAITFGLDTPLVIAPGSSQVLALTCDVAPGTPAGTVTISVNPASIPAADLTTGATIVPAADLVGPSGTPAPTYGTVTISPSSASSGNSTPGVPNTGAGGESGMMYVLLVLSGASALLGTVALKVRTTSRG